MKNFKKTISMIVTFSLVLSGLSGCGKGDGNLVNRDGTATGAIYQNRSEDIKYNLRQDVAANNAQTNPKDGQLQAEHFLVIPSTTDNLRIGDIGNDGGVVGTNFIGTRGEEECQQSNNFSSIFSSKDSLAVDRNVLSFRGNVPSELKGNKGDLVRFKGEAAQREGVLPAGKDKDLRVKAQSVKGLLGKGLKISDKSLSFHGQIPNMPIHVSITGEVGAAYIKTVKKKAEEKREPAVQCSMRTDDPRFWRFDKHDDAKGTKSWEEQLNTDEGWEWLRKDIESGGIWVRHKQGVVWVLSTVGGRRWSDGPDGMNLADAIVSEGKVKNPNSTGDWHWDVPDVEDLTSMMFGREGWLWLLLLSEEERKKFIEEEPIGQAFSKTLNWQAFNRALEDDKGETRNKLLAMKQPCHAEEEKVNQWLDLPYGGRYSMRGDLLMMDWLEKDQGKQYQKAYREKMEIFKSSPFAAALKKWEKETQDPEVAGWIKRQKLTQKCDGKTYQKDMTIVIAKEDCLRMHPESSGIEWIAEQDTQFWEKWLADEQGGKEGFFRQNLAEHLKVLEKDYGLIFVGTDIWLKLIKSGDGDYFLNPKEPEHGDPKYEEKHKLYTETVEESKKFMETEAWLEFLISPNGLDFLESTHGLAFWGSKNAYNFLNSQNGPKFLDSENWHKVLNSKEMWDKFLKTDACTMFLASPNGLEFLKSPSGLDFLTSLNGLDLLISPKGLDLLTSPNGLDLLTSPNGLEFLKSPNGLEFLKSPNGLEFLKSSNGLKFLKSSNGLKFLNSPNGLEFLKSPNAMEFLKSPNGLDLLNSPNGLKLLKSSNGLEFLNSPNGLEFLKSSNGLEFLNSKNGNEYKKESEWRKFWKAANGRKYKKWLYSNDYSCNIQTAGEPQETIVSLSNMMVIAVSEAVLAFGTKRIAFLQNNVAVARNVLAAIANVNEAVNNVNTVVAVVPGGGDPVVVAAVANANVAVNVANAAGIALAAPGANNVAAALANTAAARANMAAGNVINNVAVGGGPAPAGALLGTNINAMDAANVANAAEINAFLADNVFNALTPVVLMSSVVVAGVVALLAGETAKAVGAGWWATKVATFGGGIAGGAGVLAVAVGLASPFGIGLAVVGGAGLAVSGITLLGAYIDQW